MKKKQKLQETYANVRNDTTDPNLIQVIQKLDRVANAPHPPARLNWTTIQALYINVLEE